MHSWIVCYAVILIMPHCDCTIENLVKLKYSNLASQVELPHLKLESFDLSHISEHLWRSKNVNILPKRFFWLLLLRFVWKQTCTSILVIRSILPIWCPRVIHLLLKIPIFCSQAWFFSFYRKRLWCECLWFIPTFLSLFLLQSTNPCWDWWLLGWSRVSNLFVCRGKFFLKAAECLILKWSEPLNFGDGWHCHCQNYEENLLAPSMDILGCAIPSFTIVC